MSRLVINQLGDFRDIGVSVFGITVAGFGVLDVERGINLVANHLGERRGMDVIGRADVHRFAVGTIVSQQAVVRVDDIVDVSNHRN